MPHAPDEKLLADSCRGNRDALAELLQRCAPALRAHVAERLDSIWRSLIDEDDILQVTFVDVFEDIVRFQPSGAGAFVRWLEKMAENNLRDAIRGFSAAKRADPRRRVQASASADESCLELIELLGAHSQTPSRVSAAREAAQWLRQVMKRLPTDYRRVIELMDIQQQSPQETATTMKKSVGAVHMLRARAHDRLRALLPTASSFFCR